MYGFVINLPEKGPVMTREVPTSAQVSRLVKRVRKYYEALPKVTQEPIIKLSYEIAADGNACVELGLSRANPGCEGTMAAAMYMLSPYVEEIKEVLGFSL